MTNIAISLRVSNAEKYIERRDCIDQRWIELIISCGLNPILIPNNLVYLNNFINIHNVSGLMLTGGNDLQNMVAMHQKEAETFLLEHCIENNIPVLGICRGMQLIQNYFNIKLLPVSGHVNQYHELTVNKDLNIIHLLIQ